MSMYVDNAHFFAAEVQTAISFPGEISFKVDRMSVSKLPTLLLALMKLGITTRTNLLRQLKVVGCEITHPDVDFVLEVMEGSDRSRHLWRLTSGGDYLPHAGVLEDELPD